MADLKEIKCIYCKRKYTEADMFEIVKVVTNNDSYGVVDTETVLEVIKRIREEADNDR